MKYIEKGQIIVLIKIISDYIFSKCFYIKNCKPEQYSICYFFNPEIWYKYHLYIYRHANVLFSHTLSYNVYIMNLN